jgi:hypothetical protein
MAKSEWHTANELRVETPSKNYYFEIATNNDGSRRINMKEFQKSYGLRPSQTRSIIIFENHFRDVFKGLIKVAKRMNIDLDPILNPILEQKK